MIRLAPILASLTLLIGTPAAADSHAEPVLIGDIGSCVKENKGVRGAFVECLKHSHNACLTMPMFEPASLACFLSAKEEWSLKIAERMAELGATENDRIQQIAAIEVKYDGQANLMKCARQRDLNILGDSPMANIAFVHAECEATATAQTYLQLLAKSGGLN